MTVLLVQADARQIPLQDKSVHCCVTSPPYWGLRDYGVAGQLGLEETPEEYIAAMVGVFREVRRVLSDVGTLWVNMGDSYCANGKGGRDEEVRSRGKNLPRGSSRWGGGNSEVANLKCKDLVGIPWMLAFALRSDGWYLRSDIIWSKPNPMPESVTDRPTKAHEYIFLLSKSERYYYDADAILEPVSLNTHMRLAQDVATQIGSARANGGAKTNGNMKAVARSHKSWNGSKFDDARDLEIRPNTGRKRSDPGLGIKYNDSFDAAVCLPVEARNKRSVWTVNVQGFAEAHFATFPEELIKPCILAGCPAGGTVLDPFAGSGTTLLVARELQCKGIGIELNPAYIEIAKRRLSQGVLEFKP